MELQIDHPYFQAEGEELEERYRKFFDEALKLLNRRERFVLEERRKGKSFREIGEELGITRQRVKQIEKRIRKKLESPWLYLPVLNRLEGVERKSVYESELPEYVKYALIRNGIIFLDEIPKEEEELESLYKIGRYSLQKIKELQRNYDPLLP
ncbi:MAG: hypothetical protein DRP12_02600 [Candidatus Aenigmatarchaeota archaeon]|nr:MAG: hypothetical protein DRP12_02600 [Candidatus Aenigmarchaeota archaeon]